MIYTSYFSNLRNIPNTITPIAICIKNPAFYSGLSYKKLAPKYSFFKVWQQTKDNQYYVNNYFKLVLDPLNVHNVVTELKTLANTEDIVLLCYEKPSDFCHRHLVANWLNKNGYECEEFDKNKIRNDIL